MVIDKKALFGLIFLLMTLQKIKILNIGFIKQSKNQCCLLTKSQQYVPSFQIENKQQKYFQLAELSHFLMFVYFLTFAQSLLKLWSNLTQKTLFLKKLRKNQKTKKALMKWKTILRNWNLSLRICSWYCRNEGKFKVIYSKCYKNSNQLSTFTVFGPFNPIPNRHGHVTLI